MNMIWCDVSLLRISFMIANASWFHAQRWSRPIGVSKTGLARSLGKYPLQPLQDFKKMLLLRRFHCFSLVTFRL